MLRNNPQSNSYNLKISVRIKLISHKTESGKIKI